MRVIGYYCGYEIIHRCQIEKQEEKLRKWHEDEDRRRNNRRKRKPKITPHVPYVLRDEIYSGDGNQTDWCITPSKLHRRYDDNEILMDLFRYERRRLDFSYLYDLFEDATRRTIAADKDKTSGPLGLDKFRLIEAVQSLIKAFTEDINMSYVMDRLKPNRKKKPEKICLADYAKSLLIERFKCFHSDLQKQHQQGCNDSEPETQSHDTTYDLADMDVILDIWLNGIDWEKVTKKNNDEQDFFMIVIRDQMKEIKGADFDFSGLDKNQTIFTRQEMAACWRQVLTEIKKKFNNLRSCRLPIPYLFALQTFSELAYATLVSNRSIMSLERKGLKSRILNTTFLIYF